MQTIALVDYGIGNLRSVEKALKTVSAAVPGGAQVTLTSSPAAILAADKVVLPGVGAFGDGMAGLQARRLVEAIQEVAARGAALLGICLGMQLLFEASEELGHHKGLGLLPGKVRRFPAADLKVPQTGWNQILFEPGFPLLEGLEPGCYAYFNHSFYCEPSDPQVVHGRTEYGLTYASVVGSGRLYGAQFHPEKSQSVGLQMLRNFVEKC